MTKLNDAFTPLVNLSCLPFVSSIDINVDLVSASIGVTPERRGRSKDGSNASPPRSRSSSRGPTTYPSPTQNEPYEDDVAAVTAALVRTLGQDHIMVSEMWPKLCGTPYERFAAWLARHPPPDAQVTEAEMKDAVRRFLGDGDMLNQAEAESEREASSEGDDDFERLERVSFCFSDDFFVFFVFASQYSF